MSHAGHGITYCSVCKKAIKSCRCMDNNKPIHYEVCDKCKELADGEKDNGSPERDGSVRSL